MKMSSIFSRQMFDDILNAFRLYPFISSASLYVAMFFIMNILLTTPALLSENIWHFNNMLITIAFGVESLFIYLQGLRFLSHKNFTLPTHIIQIAKFAFYVLVAMLLYFYIDFLSLKDFDPRHYLYLYALYLICFLAFFALKIGDSFHSLYNATFCALFITSIGVVITICWLIFTGLFYALFDIWNQKFTFIPIICVSEMIFLLFLGAFERERKSKFGIFLRILNIFATIYIAMFLLYFISITLGFTTSKESFSIVHLVLWYIFFALFLWWLNMAQNPLDSMSQDPRQKLTKIMRVVIPLSALFVLNAIAFYAIIIRINQYGVTLSRYFVLVACIALFANLALGAFCKKPIQKGILTLMALIAFSAFGGKYNAINLSIDSQIKQLKIAEYNGDLSRMSDINYALRRLGYKE